MLTHVDNENFDYWLVSHLSIIITSQTIVDHFLNSVPRGVRPMGGISKGMRPVLEIGSNKLGVTGFDPLFSI